MKNIYQKKNTVHLLLALVLLVLTIMPVFILSAYVHPDYGDDYRNIVSKQSGVVSHFSLYTRNIGVITNSFLPYPEAPLGINFFYKFQIFHMIHSLLLQIWCLFSLYYFIKVIGKYLNISALSIFILFSITVFLFYDCGYCKK